MRHIPLDNFKPKPEWVTRAEEATKALLDCKTHDERMEYIKAHAKVWRELREQLIEKFGPKCWFTDAPELVARLDVEHFRPKAKALDLDLTKFEKGKTSECPETEREGYWWLAFDPDNLRLCGQIPNREHKKCYFPLHAGSKIAERGKVSWREESNVFLDPTVADDVLLVRYGEDGALHPRGDSSPWEQMRVEITDELFGLSAYQPLVEARQKVWQECSKLILDYVKLLKEEKSLSAPSVAIKEQKNQIVLRLKAMTDSSVPLASVAASCLQQSPFEWARAIAAQQHKIK